MRIKNVANFIVIYMISSGMICTSYLLKLAVFVFVFNYVCIMK